MNPHFYRLRKGTVGKDLGVPERATERCERDFLSLVLRVGNSNANRPERPRPYQAMDLQLLKDDKSLRFHIGLRPTLPQVRE